jgi:hypothetical protein
MDPQSANSPDLRMPPPSVGPDSSSTGFGQGNDSSPAPEPQVKLSDAADTVLVNPNDASPHQAPPTPSVSVQDDGGAVMADDDDDSLDEEWIQKAKVIVDQTRADPYQQSKEISKVKANYLKTHYNKDIKVADDQSL